ncbi:MAG TPA: hypothetical protein VF290_02410 [Pyrinomonadaceae bacterium]
MANEFPTPAFSGPPYFKYLKHPLDYKEITIFSQYEDGGVDTNESATTAPQRWTFIYRGLTQTQAKVILDHYNTNRLSGTFSFQEPRNDPWTGMTGTTHSGVQYEEAVEQSEHDKTWIQSLTVKLIKRP